MAELFSFQTLSYDSRNSEVFAHSNFKMALSFVQIGSTGATTLKFVNNVIMSENLNFILKYGKNNNPLALSLE